MALVLNLEGERPAGHKGVNVEDPVQSVLSLTFHPIYLPS